MVDEEIVPSRRHAVGLSPLAARYDVPIRMRPPPIHARPGGYGRAGAASAWVGRGMGMGRFGGMGGPGMGG